MTIALRSVSENANGATAVSVPLPAGTAVNDLLVVNMYVDAATVTVPAGWTLHTSDTLSNRLKVLSRVADGTESATLSFDLSANSNFAVIAQAFSGASAPKVASVGPYTASDSAAQLIVPSFEATEPGMLVFLGGQRQSSVTFTAVTAGLSIVEQISGAMAAVAANRALSSTGATGEHRVDSNQSAVPQNATALVVAESNVAPNAPTVTAPANNATLDRAVTQRFDWDFSDPDVGDSQSQYDLRYRVEGTSTWTVVSGTTPNTFHDFAGGTFAAGDFEWQVRTYDAQGVVGPYSASSFFTAADAPVAPTITAPVSGGTVGPTFTVTWSYPSQAAYQVRTVADNAGSPDTSTIYSDTGVVESTTARSRSVSFPVNGRYEHVQVRIRDTNGLYSAYASHRVLVSYTPPAVPWARVTPDSSSASIAVDVVNSTAWGYGGSSAAKNAASAALIDLAALGVARVLWLPGTAGNFVSTPDRNMLPAHADSFEDGTTGGWVAGFGGSTVAASTAQAFHGTRSLANTADANADVNGTYRALGPNVTATAGTAYTGSTYFRTTATRDVGLELVWYDAAGANLGGSAVGAVQTLAAGSWARVTVTGTAPANTASVRVNALTNKGTGGTIAVGEVSYLDAIQVEAAGSASPFTPSLRVTGDLDLRAHVALEDWTPGTAAFLCGQYTASTGGRGYMLVVGTTGNLSLYYGTGDGSTSVQATSTVATGLADGTAKHVRATRSSSTGEVRFYLSDDGSTWTALGGVVTTTAGAMALSSHFASVGGSPNALGLVKGKVLSASVRAGIDGPEVAAYDATAHTDATFTDSTGKAWTVSRSGDATAEVVDRSTWAFTGSEYLTLPDRDSLDPGTDSFTAVVGYAARIGSKVDGRLLGKRAGVPSVYSMIVGSQGFEAEIRDNAPATGKQTPATGGAWRSAAMELDRAAKTLTGLLDGTRSVARDASTLTGSLADTAPLVIGNMAQGGGWQLHGFVRWVALFRRTLTAAEHAALAAWDGSVATEPEFLRTGAALYVNAADSNQRTQYAARNLVLNLARTADEGGVASDLPVVTENRVWRSELLPSGQWSTPMRVKLGLTPDGVWTDYTPASGREYRYEVEAVGDNGTAIRSGFVT